MTSKRNKAIKLEDGRELVEQLMDLNDLRIDESYQRRKSPTKIRAMSNAWNPLLAGRPYVALRANGECYTVDGQTRVAALLLQGVTQFPCLVFLSKGQEDEADLFIRWNKERRNVNQYEYFKGELTAGTTSAVGLNALLDAYGVKISSTHQRIKGSSRAIAALREAFMTGPEELEDILPLLVDLCPESIPNNFVKGFHYLAMENLNKLSLREFRDQIMKVGYTRFHSVIPGRAGGKDAYQLAMMYYALINAAGGRGGRKLRMNDKDIEYPSVKKSKATKPDEAFGQHYDKRGRRISRRSLSRPMSAARLSA